MSRRKRRRKSEDVTLNMAAMLDMAFQLLTFFILTFKPAPIEWEVLLRMPPPESMVVRQGKAPGSDTKSTDPLRGLDTLALEVIANKNGGISSIQVEGSAMGNNMSLLSDKLQG